MGCILSEMRNCCRSAGVYLTSSCEVIYCCKKKRKTAKQSELIMVKELEFQRSFGEQDQFVDSNSRTYSGLIDKNDQGNDNLLVFTRKNVVNMWEALEKLKNSSKNRLHISGPPGTGKSTVAWAWVCSTARLHNIVWAHMNKAGLITICHFIKNKLRCFHSSAKSFGNLIKVKITV